VQVFLSSNIYLLTFFSVGFIVIPMEKQASKKLRSKDFRVNKLTLVGFRPVVENREWLYERIKQENSSMNWFLNNLISRIRQGEIEFK